MLEKNFIIGGEQSGHIIFLDYASTGDGQLTGVQMLGIMCRKGKALKELAKVMTIYPQVLKNIMVSPASKDKFSTCKPVWDAVENADAYVVDINGSTKQVDTNACFHVPTEGVTEFKVKAIDTTGEYEDSKWSNVYTHTVDATVEENLYSRVNIFVNDILEGFKLKEIVAVYANGNNLYTQVICQYNGSDYFHNIITEYDTRITSIEQAMSLESGVSYLGMGQQIVDHNSAEHLLKSDTLTGSLEDYKKEGYTISVVASQTVQEKGYADGSAYSIYGTYKLEKNGEVKYVQAAYQCVITNPSSNPTTNYTTKLENSNDRYLSELNFTELTGDFEEYAETMDGLNSTVYTNFGHANQQSGDDMSY